MSGTQYLRKCSLIVADDTGDGLDLSQLRITFTVTKTEAESPNTAEIKVYNLSDDTAQRIQKEFTRVRLQAGYVEGFGLIFDGTVKQVYRGRENGTDTFLGIVAADGDKSYNFAVVNKTLAAGSTQRDQMGAAIESMNAGGVSTGYLPDSPGDRLPRGKVMYGMARGYMRQSSQTTNSSWSIQDGKVQVVPLTGLLPTQAVVLNSRTGLIGTPEQSTEGINVKCLLNPLLKIGGKVQIKEEDIQRAKLDLTQKEGEKEKAKPAKIADDGSYRLIKVEHVGDTTGQDWYSNLICIDVDETSPKQKSVSKV